MFRFKQNIQTQYTVNQLLTHIQNNLSPEIDYQLFNPFIFIKQLKQSANDNNPFSGNIELNTIKLNSKNVMYWPSSYLLLIENNQGTYVKIKYRFSRFYASIYLAIAMPAFLVIGYVLLFKFNSMNIMQITNFVFSLLCLTIIPIYVAWAQKNVIKFITNL